MLIMTILETRTQTWLQEADCQACAQALAHAWMQMAIAVGARLVVELHGDLGAGKTTWTRHLLRALGVTGTIKSPSYTVLETYTTACTSVAHFDFYRFQDPLEWEDAGFREVYASPGLKLAEWPEKAQGLLPQPDLQLHIQCKGLGTEREVRLEAGSPSGAAWLRLALGPSQDTGTNPGTP